MKLKDIARENGFDVNDFERFLNANGIAIRTAFPGTKHLDDFKVPVERYKAYLDSIRQAEEAHRRALDAILLTNCETFPGYRITRIGGMISTDYAVPINRSEYMSYPDAMRLCREQIIAEMKEQACILGCGGICGIDISYVTMAAQEVSGDGKLLMQPYILCASGMATAVCIEQA